MEMELRSMTPEEQKYSYSQDPDDMRKAGCIGHLRVDMDTNGVGFYSSWDDHNRILKTDDFKEEFDNVINALRNDEQYGGILKNRTALAEYCRQNDDSSFDNGREFGFRADTEEYSYLLRLNPNRGEYAAYIYAYDRELLDGALSTAQELMNVLVVEPGQTPYVKAIQTGLESLQRETHADIIQAVYPFADRVALICDDEGKINGSELNRALRDENNHIYDVVAGTFLIVGLGEEDFTSITQAQAERFEKMFHTPEMFIQMDGKLMVIPVEEQHRPSVRAKLDALQKAERPQRQIPHKTGREER